VMEDEAEAEEEEEVVEGQIAISGSYPGRWIANADSEHGLPAAKNDSGCQVRRCA
jgi:hypothetical protein